MREARIRTDKLGLKVGDMLTFNDGQTRATIKGLREYIIRVIPEKPEIQKCRIPYTENLRDLTFRLTKKCPSHNECLAVWWLNKQTLKQRHEELQNKTTDSAITAIQLRKSAWVKNISNDGNLFYTETCFRFLKNVFSNYKGTLADRDIFQRIGDVMATNKLASILYASTTEAIRKELERREYGRIIEQQDEEPKDILMALYKHPKSNTLFRHKLVEWLNYAQKRLSDWQQTKPDPAKGKFEELRTLLDLSAVEFDILLSVTLFDNGMLDSTDFKQHRGLARDHVIKMAVLVGVSESDYLKATKRQSKLRRLGCIDQDIDLNTDILPFINGMNEVPLANRYFKKHEDEALPWRFFGSLGDKHGTLIQQMIAGRSPDRGINILLYGEPGTGKTSFAQALTKELGYTAYMIAQTNDHEKEPPSKAFRFAAVQVCDSQVDRKRSIMIVDEADKMLESGVGSFMDMRMLLGDGSGSCDKGEINDILDTIKTPCIWITNSRASQLDASNRRRFDYSIPFEKLTHDQRKMIWRNVVTKHQIGATVTEAMIERLAVKYEINAGGISLAVRNLSDMLTSGTAPVTEAESLLKRILEPHCKLLNIKDNTARMVVAQDYSLDGLNIKGSMKLEQIVAGVHRFQSEQDSEQTQGVDRPRMNLLLSGSPGTGKTEFVKYLGATLNTRVVTRMGSDLLDMYVGGTEKNIKRAFEEASREKAILFLDELDGMIQSRERAQRSWEVTQVNELLHQMENFDGVMIGATNFVTNLDPATLRRFTFKIEFEPLDNTGKALFFTRVFAPMGIGDLSTVERQRLHAIQSITPGDFRTVRQSLYYLATTTTTDQVLEALERESLTKRSGLPQGRIGFM